MVVIFVLQENLYSLFKFVKYLVLNLIKRKKAITCKE